MVMTQIRKLLMLLAFMQIVGCSNNLDLECAEFYEEVNNALDVIISTKSEAQKSKHIENLNTFSGEFSSLQMKVERRYEEKMASGKISSKFVFDDLTQRKAVALNGFFDRSGNIKNQPKILVDMFELSIGCNHALR